MLIMPIVYSPESMEEHHTVMVISANDILKWRYPLKGITEKTSTGIDYVFRIKCREAIERKIPIYLPDLTDMEMEEVFSHEVRVTEK